MLCRYLAARRLLLKAAQYRPGKYKQVSPTLAATPAVAGGQMGIVTKNVLYLLAALQSIYTLEDRPSSTNTSTECNTPVPDVFKSIVGCESIPISRNVRSCVRPSVR